MTNAFQPNYNSFLDISISPTGSQYQLQWPDINPYYEYPFSTIIQVSGMAITQKSTIIMPDETYSGMAQSVIIINSSDYDVDINSSGGEKIITINPSDNDQSQANAYVLVLINNIVKTRDAWLSIPLGSMGSSSLVESLSGNGLSVVNDKLTTILPFISQTSSYNQQTSDQSNIILFSGNSNCTYTLLDVSSSLPNGFFFGVKNDLTTGNVLIVNANNTDTINGINYTPDNPFILPKGGVCLFVSDGQNNLNIISKISQDQNSFSVNYIPLNQTPITIPVNDTSSNIQVIQTGTLSSTTDAKVNFPLNVSNVWFVANKSQNTIVVGTTNPLGGSIRIPSQGGAIVSTDKLGNLYTQNSFNILNFGTVKSVSLSTDVNNQPIFTDRTTAKQIPFPLSLLDTPLADNTLSIWKNNKWSALLPPPATATSAYRLNATSGVVSWGKTYNFPSSPTTGQFFFYDIASAPVLKATNQPNTNALILWDGQTYTSMNSPTIGQFPYFSGVEQGWTYPSGTIAPGSILYCSASSSVAPTFVTLSYSEAPGKAGMIPYWDGTSLSWTDAPSDGQTLSFNASSGKWELKDNPSLDIGENSDNAKL